MAEFMNIRMENMLSVENAKTYCSEPIQNIENYEEALNDDTQKWVCHHRLEMCFTQKFLKEIGLYYKRPADELIFIKSCEHNGNSKIHKYLRTSEYKSRISKGGKRLKSDETKKRMSEARKIYWQEHPEQRKLNNKGRKLSEETKRKIAEAHKGRTPWNKRKQ